MEHYFPAGWDLEKIDNCCSHRPEEVLERQPFWNKDFVPVPCDNDTVFGMMMGHEIALNIKEARDEEKKLVFILPVGPMGMYRWLVYFLKEWKISCKHVWGFNMDEWSDAEGNTLNPSDPGSFQYGMEAALYGPLGELTVPVNQRNFATRKNLPCYSEKIAALKAENARLITVFGIGRVFHIAFWEPQFAAEFSGTDEWKKSNYRLGAKLHPLTIEQNALHSFKSRTTRVPCFANTIGPGLFLQSDRIIGGCDGTYSRGLMWQGMSLWVTLRYGPDMWVPSSLMPTLPGKLFFIRDLAGPLEPDLN
jgi:glucosamine-6-phosphate deaminase